MSNISVLRQELTDDPLEPPIGYASMTDEEVDASLNEPRYVGRDAFSPRELKEYLLLTEVRGSSVLGRLQLLADLRPVITDGAVVGYPSMPFDRDGEPNVAIELVHVASAKALLTICDMDESNTIDQDDPDFDKMLNELANGQAKVFTNATKTAIQGLTSSMVTRAQQLGIRVNVGIIQAARS